MNVTIILYIFFSDSFLTDSINKKTNPTIDKDAVINIIQSGMPVRYASIKSTKPVEFSIALLTMSGCERMVSE
ncbi:hypothetical protein TUM17570_37010 [Enterobacter cloacae]|nr:hypothetical protein TUM17570_37010 [Enterobacter cloacae]